MDYNSITKEFGGTIKKPLQLSADELSKEFGGAVKGKTDSFFKRQNVDYSGKVMGSIEDSFVGKLFRAFTSGTRGTGETLGQSLAVNTKDFTDLEQSRQGLSDMQLKVIKEINEKKKRGEDTTRLESILAKSQNTKIESIQEIAPATTKTNRQAVGEAIQMGTELLSGGGLSGATKVSGLARTAAEAEKARKAYQALSTGQKLKKIGVDTLKLMGVSTPFGYAYDVGTNLAEDTQGKEAFTPGVATLFSTIIPLGIGGVRATKVLSKPLLEYGVGNLSGKGVPAAQQISAGGADYLGITPQQVFDDTRKSVALYDNSVSNTFGATKKQLIDQFTGTRIGIEGKNASKLRAIATEFGFGDRLPQNLQNMSVKESMDLLAEINAKGRTKITIFDSPAVREAKYTLSQLKGLVKDKAVSAFGGKGGEFDKAYSTYSKAQKVISDMENIVGSINKFKTLTPTTLKTAQNRLMKIFKDDTQSYINAIKSFESVTGERILDKVAAANFSELMPRALKSGDTMLGSYANDLIGLLTFPLSSPKIGANLISIASGYKPSAVTALLNASPKIRSSIYNAVVKENKSLDEAMTDVLEKYGKIPNKEGGFVRIGNGQKPAQSLKADQPATIQAKSTKATTAKPINATTDKNKVIISKSSNKVDIKATSVVGNTIKKVDAKYKSMVDTLIKNEIPSGLIDDLRKVPDYVDTKKITNEMSGKEFMQNVREQLRRHGVDGFSLNDRSMADLSESLIRRVDKVPKFKQNPKTGKMEGSIKSSPLTDSIKKADPLIEEAKKYKTPEEFVKAQRFQHVTGKNNATKIDGGGFSGDKVYLWTDKDIAAKYANRVAKESKDSPTIMDIAVHGRLRDIVVSDNRRATATMLEDMGKSRSDYGQYADPIKIQQDYGKWLKENGYVGYSVKGNETVIFDKSAIKTKSQLTDIWNKANKMGENDTVRLYRGQNGWDYQDYLENK